MGWFIMNKYYELTDIVLAYATALLLDPSKRAAYIRQDWPEEWRQKAYDSAHKIWAEEYRDLILEPLKLDSMSIEISPPSPIEPKNTLDQLKQSLAVPTASPTEGDDIARFILIPQSRSNP
jgi:hypothetical protein